MSNSGSGDGPMRGRRPAPRRPAGGGQRPPTPQRPAPPQRDEPEDDADERTQALDLSTLDLDGGAAEEDAGEATVAMQLPQELLDEGARGGGGKKTIMGHPGVSARTASAVRGSAPAPRRNETLAMDQRSAQEAVRRASPQRPAPPPADDDGEATMAMNVDSLLAQIDEQQSQRPAPSRAPAPAPAPTFDDDDDEGEGATMAMSLDDLKAKAASTRSAPARTPAPAPSRPAPAPALDEEDENESTMAVDMSDVVGQIAARNAGRPAPGRQAPAPAATFDDDEDESEATMAMNVDDMRAEMQRKAATAASQRAPVAARATPAVAAAAGAALGAAPSTEGLLGPVAYALSFDGRKQQIEDSLAAIDAGTAPPEVARDAQRYRAEQGALDPEAAKKGWITLGAIAGGFTGLVVVLGLIL